MENRPQNTWPEMIDYLMYHLDRMIISGWISKEDSGPQKE